MECAIRLVKLVKDVPYLLPQSLSNLYTNIPNRAYCGFIVAVTSMLYL